MKKSTIIIIVIVAVILLFIGSFVSRYNQMVKAKVEVENQWSQVENQYQRRFDLIPNLVETVKGYAAHESETLIAVTEARSKVGGVVNAGNVINDPQAFAKFQEMQAGLSGALQRLMVVVERYPDLKANQNFLALQSQLEGTENRISVARRDFNEASKRYNQMIVTFPNNILAGMFNLTKLEFFQATTGAEEAPKVQF
ncbi:MAG: LemA family protein [Candidatus Cloacimonetes bacterium]|nr:LemA family protein [Candidatus Cloacimonadota bacterium]